MEYQYLDRKDISEISSAEIGITNLHFEENISTSNKKYILKKFHNTKKISNRELAKSITRIEKSINKLLKVLNKNTKNRSFISNFQENDEKFNKLYNNLSRVVLDLKLLTNHKIYSAKMKFLLMKIKYFFISIFQRICSVFHKHKTNINS